MATMLKPIYVTSLPWAAVAFSKPSHTFIYSFCYIWCNRDGEGDDYQVLKCGGSCHREWFKTLPCISCGMSTGPLFPSFIQCDDFAKFLKARKIQGHFSCLSKVILNIMVHDKYFMLSVKQIFGLKKKSIKFLPCFKKKKMNMFANCEEAQIQENNTSLFLVCMCIHF